MGVVAQCERIVGHHSKSPSARVNRLVEFLNRMGGNVPSHDEVLALVREQALRYAPAIATEEERMAHV